MPQFKLALLFDLLAVVFYAPAVSVVTGGRDGSATNPGKRKNQVNPTLYTPSTRKGYTSYSSSSSSSGGTQYTPSTSKITKFDKLLKTDAAQCLKDAKTDGDKQLFEGYSVPAESYCVCMHSKGGGDKDMCNVQAEILLGALSKHYGPKRQVDDAAEKAKLFISQGPDVSWVQIGCSSVEWNKEKKELKFSSKCGKATYDGDIDWTKDVDAWKKDPKWKPTHSLTYKGRISSATISATIEFGPDEKPENAQATNVKCEATATAWNHHFIISSSVDKSKDSDLKSDTAEALSAVKDMLTQVNKAEGKTEGDFICEVLENAIAKALKQLPKDNVNLLTTTSRAYSNENMQEEVDA